MWVTPEAPPFGQITVERTIAARGVEAGFVGVLRDFLVGCSRAPFKRVVFTTTTSFLCAEFVDPGGSQGDIVRILAK